MSKKNVILAGAALGAVVSLGLYFALARSQVPAPAESSPAPSETAPGESQQPEGSQSAQRVQPTTRMAAKADVPPLADLPAFETRDELLENLAEVDFFRAGDREKLIERLKATHAPEVALGFVEGLKQAGMQDPGMRNRLILVADSWRDPALLPLWQNLAWRETPRDPNERELIFAEEPSEGSRSVMLEMTTAISNLGILASRDKAALESLRKIVLEPNPDIHSVYLRERAFAALREANLAASNRILKSLKADDELRSRLIPAP